MTTTTTKAQSSSEHLAHARELLGDLDEVTRGPDGDPQVKASAAAAHAILVLAEQVAVVRVLMASDAAQAANSRKAAAQS
jgi:hypothetical protein